MIVAIVISMGRPGIDERVCVQHHIMLGAGRS